MKPKLLLFMGVTLLLSCDDMENTEPVPTSVSISSVRVLTYPLTDGGSSWDVDGDADLIFGIENASAVLYSHSVYFQDVNGSMLPLLFSMNSPYLLPQMNQSYYITLWDYDVTSDNDFIASIGFNPENFKKERPASKIFQNSDVQIQVYFTWK